MLRRRQIINDQLKQRFVVVHGWPWVLSVQKPCAGLCLALGFKVEQLAGYTVAVDFIAAIGDGLFQLGHAGFIDNRLVAQRVSDLLQLLSLIAQVNRFPALAGAGLFGLGGRWLGLGFYAVLGTAGARTAGQCRGVIQTTEIDDHDKKTSGYLRSEE